jgi:hypothetical protein
MVSLSARRRDAYRYHNDPEYREKARAWGRAYNLRKRNEKAIEKKPPNPRTVVRRRYFQTEKWKKYRQEYEQRPEIRDRRSYLLWKHSLEKKIREIEAVPEEVRGPIKCERLAGYRALLVTNTPVNKEYFDVLRDKNLCGGAAIGGKPTLKTMVAEAAFESRLDDEKYRAFMGLSKRRRRGFEYWDVVKRLQNKGIKINKKTLDEIKFHLNGNKWTNKICFERFCRIPYNRFTDSELEELVYKMRSYGKTQLLQAPILDKNTLKWKKIRELVGFLKK